MARALVLGSSGVVGRAVAARLSELDGVEVKCANRSGEGGAEQFDASDPTSLDRLFEGVDLVVNAVGLLRSHPDYPGDQYRLEAARVNGVFPLVVADTAQRAGCKVVHVSTDAVFEAGDTPAHETTEVGPSEPYGLTKALGESASDVVVNVRCSVVGPGPGRPGLWEWLVTQPPEVEVPGFSGRIWTGVTSRQLAVLCGDLLDAAAFARVRSAGPWQHFVPNEPITKFDLLRLLAEAVRPDITVVEDAAGGPPGRQLESRTGALDAVFSGTRGWTGAVREAVQAG